MSVVMKPFERLVLTHLKDITSPLLDTLQFAYRANRLVDDAVNMGLHHVLQLLDTLGIYPMGLFVDFSSVFNTIKPGNSSPQTLPFYCAGLHLSVDHTFSDRQDKAGEAGKDLIQHPDHWHQSPSRMCALPTALLPPRQRLHLRGPVC